MKNIDIRLPGIKRSNERNRNTSTFNGNWAILLAIVPIVILSGMVMFLLSPFGQSLLNTGIPLPEISIEKVEFRDSQIVAFIRNTGPLEVVISHADVNDRIQSAAIEPSSTLSRLDEATVIMPFPWNPGEPYEIGVTTSDGTRFSKNVEAAALAPTPDPEQALLFASLGIYVGVIPIMIGLLWYPYIRRLSVGKYDFFLSLTAGLLTFLGIDALLEGNEIVAQNLSAAFNGQLLIILVAVSSFLLLMYTSERLMRRALEKSVLRKDADLSSSSPTSRALLPGNKEVVGVDGTTTAPLPSPSSPEPQVKVQMYPQILRPLTISMMIAIGIGLHNFGEGLAIGAAMILGEIALSTFLSWIYITQYY